MPSENNQEGLPGGGALQEEGVRKEGAFAGRCSSRCKGPVAGERNNFNLGLYSLELQKQFSS